MKQSEMPNPRGFWVDVAEKMKVGDTRYCRTDKDARNLTRALRNLGLEAVRRTNSDGTVNVWRLK